MIRKVTEKDAAAIADLYNVYVSGDTASFETEEVSEAQMASRIREISSGCPYFVWEEKGEILGYCYAHPWKERAAYCHTLETTVYIAPAAKKRGIGKKLMERLIEECRQQGIHSLIACITGENSASIAFHTRLGFSRVSYFREVGRKFGRWLDVVDMELLLQQ